MPIVIVDDTDPQIVYSDKNWFLDGNPQREWNGTVHATNIIGAGYTITFMGTSISVFGTISGGVTQPLRSIYQLDNGTSTIYNAPLNVADVTYHNAFYTSPDVPYGVHTLNVSMDSVSGAGNVYWLDYITYTILAPNSTMSLAPPSDGMPAITSSARNSVLSLSVLIPAIVVPVCACLVLVLVGFWWVARRRRVSLEDTIPEVFVSSERPEASVVSPTWSIDPYPASYTEPQGHFQAQRHWERQDNSENRSVTLHGPVIAPVVTPSLTRHGHSLRNGPGRDDRRSLYRGDALKDDTPPAYTSTC